MSLTASTNQAYNSNAVQYGSIIAVIKRGNSRGAATTIGTYILEGVTVNRATKSIEKPDEIGGPNGFALINAQNTGSCVVQIGPSTDKRPQNGDWFEYTLDADMGLERFVMKDIGDARGINDYFKTTANLMKDHFPTA